MNTRSRLDFGEVDASIALLDFDRAHEQLESLTATATLEVDRARVDFTRAVLLVQEGDAAQACEILSKLNGRHPDRRDFWRSYLTALKGLDIPDAAFVGAHRLYAARFIRDEAPSPGPRAPSPATTLHVGYVGPDGHMAILRFLRHLPHSRHRSTFGGHGRGCALEVLACRPAPLMATWLDYLATTGVPAIDCRITDWVADPPGNERLHTEQLARLPFAPGATRPTKTRPTSRHAVGRWSSAARAFR